MLKINGKYANAVVYSDNMEEKAKSQIIELLNQEFVEGCKIRIMPDVHVGAGCVIGFTADLGDKVIPNIVGVDIGCGVLAVNLGKENLDLKMLDKIIYDYIPNGFGVHKTKVSEFPKLKDLICYSDLKNSLHIERSIGSLGGGNHFIEVNTDEIGNKYLVIHSGSRNLGKQVAEYYQKIAIKKHSVEIVNLKNKNEVIKELKAKNQEHLIQSELNKIDEQIKSAKPKFPEGLCYLTGVERDDYLHDMKICQEYAILNRNTIAHIILDKLFGTSLSEYEHFHTVHNYINFEDNIIRKGSISAKNGEKVLIPINMRDGSLLCIGKGNEEWNSSAPHGAGRLMSRNKAKKNIDIDDFKQEMKGVYTTSISDETLDEAPMAYKKMEDITKYIGETVDVISVLKPIYNFKAPGNF